MKGVAYIKVKVRFELDLTDEQIEEVINEVDYEFNHPFIESTEIIEVEQF